MKKFSNFLLSKDEIRFDLKKVLQSFKPFLIIRESKFSLEFFKISLNAKEDKNKKAKSNLKAVIFKVF